MKTMLRFVTIENTGIPIPGGTMLLIAAIYAGMIHRLSFPLVLATVLAAIVGDTIGLWVISSFHNLHNSNESSY